MKYIVKDATPSLVESLTDKYSHPVLGLLNDNRPFILASGKRKYKDYDVPSDEVWYISNNKKVINIDIAAHAEDTVQFGFALISNTYENGHGILKFDGTVTGIPSVFSEIDDYPVYNLENHHLVEVYLPSTVNAINSAAFSNCIYLEYVNIPNGITEIQPYTFLNCNSLRYMNLPDSVYSVGPYAFHGAATNYEFSVVCSGQLSDKISSDMADGFQCTITNLRFTDITTELTSLQNFYRRVKNIDLNNVQTIAENVFSYATFETLTIPATVNSIASNAFAFLQNLKEIHLSDSTDINADSFSLVLTSGKLYYTSSDGSSLPDEKLGQFVGWELYINGEDMGEIVNPTH